MEAVQMNTNEKEIIKHLRHGKRVNISQIARELGMPITTVADRIRKIERNHITKRSSPLDYSSIGYNSNHMIAIKVKSGSKDVLLQMLMKNNCVNSVYRINSDYHFLVEVVFRSHLDFINWLESIKSASQVDMTSFQILKTEEREKFMPE